MKVRSATKESLALLSKRDRRLLGLSIALQALASFLDLAGVVLVGLVGAVAVTSIQSEPLPEAVAATLQVVGLQHLSSQQVVLVLAAAAACLLLSKSVVSSLLTRRVLVFLANRQALVSGRLTSELLSKPLVFIQARSTQETAYALIGGSSAATLGVLGQFIIVLTELTLLIAMAVVLVLADPLVALGAILFFAVVGYGLQRALGGWATRVGIETSVADIGSLNAVQEALGAFREVVVSQRQGVYVERIQALRWRAAKVAAETQFISMFPKYFFEVSLVIGGFALAAVLFSTQDSVAAVATLALFLAAATRVMPSLMRLQGAMLSLRALAGAAAPTYELAKALGDDAQSSSEPWAPAATTAVSLHKEGAFEPTVRLDRVTFCYREDSDPAVKDVELQIHAGMSVGLAGRSGAGKSTLADLILGLIDPTSGSVTISGVPAPTALRAWPGSIAYVPQRVMVADGTIRANVALGIHREEVDDGAVWEALKRAHLIDDIERDPMGLDMAIGEGGLKLSGGQRQRLGIARALYTRPRLLVLDEATSALDAETEATITQTIKDLEGVVTTVVIAHRLSTVRDVDMLVYLENGRVAGLGCFEEVAEAVPALRRQAKLMGLV